MSGYVLEVYDKNGVIVYDRKKECTDCRRQIKGQMYSFEGSIYNVKIDINICGVCNKEKSIKKRVDEIIKNEL